MLRYILKHVAVGALIALGTVGLCWLAVVTDFMHIDNLQLLALIVLTIELIFLLAMPANKGGQHFGPHGGELSPYSGEHLYFQDVHPSRRLGDFRRFIVAVPIVATAILVIISF